MLTSPRGLEHRSNRPIEPEAVSGQLKSNNKFNRFIFIEIEKAEMEVILTAIGHNFRKMTAKGLSFTYFLGKMQKQGCKIAKIFTFFKSILKKIFFYKYQNENFELLKITA